MAIDDRTDADREWLLDAARGKITSEGALEAVRNLRRAPETLRQDREAIQALAEGDLLSDGDPRRFPDGPPPWEQPVDVDPEATAAFDRLRWASAIHERDKARDQVEFLELELKGLREDAETARALERLEELPEEDRDAIDQLTAAWKRADALADALEHLPADRQEFARQMAEVIAGNQELQDELSRATWASRTRNHGDQGEDVDPDRHLLGLRPVADIAAEVDAAGPPTFLFSPVWPSDAYGVVAAAHKVGKSWIMLDAAVSVASGTRWLELFPCESPGPVMVFLGEGGARKMTRRGRAVARSKGLQWDELPILMSERVPRLSDDKAISALTLELDRHPAALVIIDPLYLAAAGANGKQLYEMATVLEPVQVACQRAGAALMVAHHFNRDTSRQGSDRMSGAGPAEWGRVLVSVDKSADLRDVKTGRTDVTLELSLDGDEITGGKRTVKRSVWADDVTDLGSPLNYQVQPTVPLAAPDAYDGLADCMATIVDYFREHPGVVLSKTKACAELRDYRAAREEESFRDALVGMALERLALDRVLDRTEGKRNSINFRAADHGECGDESL
jgi:hypothetical protein